MRRWGVVIAVLAIAGLLIVDPLDWFEGRPAPDTNDEGREGLLTTEGDAPSLEGRGKEEEEEEPPEPEPEPDPLPRPVDLDSCDRERDLHGVVVRTDGSPVAGAMLQVVRTPIRRGGLVTLDGHYDIRYGATARTASDGTFSFRRRTGSAVNLFVRADGSLASALFHALNPGERVRLTLRPAVTLTVKTLDANGAPLLGTSIRLFRIGGGAGDVEYRDEGRTYDPGIYVFEGLQGGREITLDAKHPEHGPSGWTRVQLVEQGPQTHVLEMPAGRPVTGIVTDADTKEPIARARVGLGWTIRHAVRTDADGRFTYPGWTGKGSSTLTAIAPGYAPQHHRVGEAKGLTFALAPAGRVVGQVLDVTGNPIHKALVAGNSVQERGDRSATAKIYTHTDANGDFVLEGTRRDRGLKLAVIALGHARHSVELPGPLGDEHDAGPIRLGPERQIRGVVVEADGTPVPRAQVFVSRYKGDRQRWSPRWYGFGDSRFTDDLGRFRFHELGPGWYGVYTRVKGRSEQKIDVEIKAGRDATNVRLMLPGVRKILVRVETPDGEPVEGMWVEGRTDRSVAIGVRGTTGADGTATLNVSPDVVGIGLNWPNDIYERYITKESGYRKLEPDTREVRFVLQEAVLTRGRVLDEDGEPVAGLHVRVGGMRHAMTSTDADGRFKLRTPKGPPVDLVVDGWAQRQLEGGAVQGYRSDYRGGLERVVPGSKDLELRVEKR